MEKVSIWFVLAKQMGLRYMVFRFFYELRKRAGFLKFSFPVSPKSKTWITLSQWRGNPPSFFIAQRDHYSISTKANDTLRDAAQRILQNEVRFFHGDWKKIDPDDWLTNIQTGHIYQLDHWTSIPDFHRQYGDIKYVWEKGRFGFVQTLVRYDAHFEYDSSAWIFSTIESWIDHNPVNLGPHWQCSQEISIRLYNWTIALHFYKDSIHLTESRFEKIIFSIYWQLRHVRSNIQFSRIAVKNNHAISESLALYLAGQVYHFFEESPTWKRDGKRWFEKEILTQFYDDGGYLQHSMNYHRVAIQLLTFAFTIAESSGDTFASAIYARAHNAVHLLKKCQDPLTGTLPNYGANDGALFFQWNDENFGNFKPSLDALHFYLTNNNLYQQTYEDRVWFNLKGKSIDLLPPLINNQPGSFEFRTAGIFGFRNNEMLLMIPCVHYADRPSQADALHIDFWYKGVNILRDAGSFQYNTDQETVNYFSGTASHNTVMLGEFSQMKKGPRFIWFNWTRRISAEGEFDNDRYSFSAEIEAFYELGSIRHQRTIDLFPNKRQLIVKDRISRSVSLPMRQLWHLPENTMLKMTSHDETGAEILAHHAQAWYAPTYGRKELSSQIEFSTFGAEIITEITIPA